MILLCCASELGLPEDLSAIEVILYYYYYYLCSSVLHQLCCWMSVLFVFLSPLSAVLLDECVICVPQSFISCVAG